MRTLVLAVTAFAAGCASSSFPDPGITALVGSGGDTSVGILYVDDEKMQPDDPRGFRSTVEVAPGPHKVMLKVQTSDRVCFPIVNVNVGEQQVLRFAAKADGSLFHVTVDVRDGSNWKKAIIAADFRGDLAAHSWRSTGPYPSQQPLGAPYGGQ